jgi:hypothetical protein
VFFEVKRKEYSVFFSIFVAVQGREVKTIPVQALRVPGVEAPRFQDNRDMKVVRLSSLSPGRLYPTGKIPGTRFY